MHFLKPIACSLITVGLSWVFAEIRRLLLHPGEIYAEAEEDRDNGRYIRIFLGATGLIIGGIVAFNVFGFGSVTFAWEHPYARGVPAITCEDRPFPYIAPVLFLTGLACLFFLP